MEHNDLSAQGMLPAFEKKKRPWQQSNVNIFKVFSGDAYFIPSISPQSTKGPPDSFSFPNVQKNKHKTQPQVCIFSSIFSSKQKH